MRPLVVVDLMSHLRDYGARLVANHHQYTAPARPLTVVGPDATPAELEGAAGIQVTGSCAMLKEDAPWAGRLAEALEAVAAQGTPILGVCFGHQLLGDHFGATLASWPDERIGLRDVAFPVDDGPFQAGTVAMLHTHRDRLTDLGPDLVSLASGGMGGVQAFRHRDLPIWGVQGHPEADAALGRAAAEFAVPGADDTAVDTVEAKGILARFGAMLQA